MATGATSVYNQGRLKGAARFGKLEGAWYGNGGSIYFVASSGGNVGQGQIFEYDPANQRLRLLFESPSADVLNAPDNITVSPRGGLVLCEDGDGIEYVHGLTTDGVIFRFIQNNVDLRTIPWNGFNPGLSRQRVCRRVLQPGWQVAVREHSIARDLVRHHRPVG